MKMGSEGIEAEADLVRRICGVYGGYETAEVGDVRRIGGGRRLREGPGKKSGWDVSGTISQSVRHQRRPVENCSPGRGGIAQDGGTRGGTLVAAEKARAGLRHAVVCPNVTGRTKERIAQSKRARAGSLALVDYYSHKWRELISSGRLVCRCHVVFLSCYICFI